MGKDKGKLEEVGAVSDKPPTPETPTVIVTDRLFHYFFRPQELETSLQDILENGIQPLSARPDSERWKQIQAHRPGFFEMIYDLAARPVIGRPYSNSGVFLTPIDFRPMAALSTSAGYMARLPRLAVPLSAIHPATAAVFYCGEDERAHSYPLNQEALRLLAEEWPATRIASLFGRDQSRMFFYVPQVAVYQEGGVRVGREALEPAV